MRIVTLAQARSDEHFVQCTSAAKIGHWICKLCTGRTFKDKIKHSKLRTHIDRVRLELERVSAAQPAAAPPGLGSRSLASSGPMFPDEEQVPANIQNTPDQINMDIFGDETTESSDDMGSLYDPFHPNDSDFCPLRASREGSLDLGDFLEDNSDAEIDSQPAPDPAVAATDKWLPWYPLRKAEHAAALLMLGTGRNLMSTAEYNRLRSILRRVLKVDLPDLGHIKNIRSDLKARLGLRVLDRISPLGNPCFTLSVCDIIKQELSNPEVGPHMEFFPEIDQRVTVDRYSQSKKWREELPTTLRVPMVVVEGEHFYIYEPTQLADSRVVVPVFFYKDKLSIRAKCLEVLTADQGSQDFLIPAEPKFDSPRFLDVNVQTFATSFLRIELWNGEKWFDSPNTQLLQHLPQGVRVVDLPNPWRAKANSMIIRSVPVVLYSDDTSGNISKKWNKHMSFYFSLAGLRPKFTNQEYHIHSLCTSNIASALEQGDQIVDELNEAASTGICAYDCTIDQEVLVLPFILCHMGDSPMHAEISNTTNPSGTLTPCRICNLTVESRAEKQTVNYVQQFVGIAQDWKPASLPLRDWAQTRVQTKQLWLLTRHPKSIRQFDDRSKSYGTRDSLNLPFAKEVQQLYRSNKSKPKQDQMSHDEIRQHCERLEDRWGEHMFNPFLRLAAFDGHVDTPVESLHVVLLGVTKYLYRDLISKLSPGDLVMITGQWQSFKIDGLNCAPIQPRNMVHYANSLLGKDFRVVLQAAPFVFFGFLPDEYRHCWIALVHLASYIFQPRLFDKEEYLLELKTVVARFLNRLVALTAQWTNKPKFHMLTHLALSVDRFGPPSLFLTEKMEAQNSTTRAASVKSNHHAPGKDISNSFNNERLVRMLCSGSSFFDSKLGTRTTASKLFRDLFQEKEIRHSLGLHLPDSSTAQNSFKVTYPKSNDSGSDHADPPNELCIQWPNGQWKKGLHAVLESGQRVVVGTFVLIDFDRNATSPIKMGRVCDLWHLVTSNLLCIRVKKIKLSAGLHAFYGMREVQETNQHAWINNNNISCVLNVQHNCYDGKCTITNSRTFCIERTAAHNRRPEVTHQPFNSFIINGGSHYSSDFHRSVTKHVWSEVTPVEWKDSIEKGLSAWFEKCPPKGVGHDPIDDPLEDDEDPSNELLV